MPDATEAKTETAGAASTERAEATVADAAVTTAPAPEASPKHPEVLAMEDALERGDFHEAREIAQRLSKSDDEALRGQGSAMAARFQLDPYVLGTLAFTGALIVALALIYLGRH